MSKRIKLENIVTSSQTHLHDGVDYSNNNFCPECGVKIIKQSIKEEYVCQGCRHLVKQTDTHCHNCGEILESSFIIEHHIVSSQIDNVVFNAIKKVLK